MAQVKILGTSHIAPESLKKVESAILKYKPDIVAIELDRKRLIALARQDKQRLRFSDIKRIGVKGWLFALIGAWIEKKLGAKVGVSPGSEMIKAVAMGQQVGAKIALIDQDIDITLRRFSKALTWKEKGRFVADLFKGIVLRKGVKFDISKVPPKKMIQQMIEEVRERYPSVYKVLIEERNEYMAKKLASIVKKHPEDTIVVVIGAGHEKEIAVLLKNYLKAETDNTLKKR